MSYWCVLRRVAGWIAWGCWDDFLLLVIQWDHSRKFPALSTRCFWAFKELQLIWVQLQLIWVWFFECALGHVDQIHIYIYMLTYVMLIFMCRYNWHCSVIHTYCICNYTYFWSWASVSVLDIKKTSLIQTIYIFVGITYIHI